MSKKQGFWGNLFGIQPERERFSLEELKHLHDVLQQNATVTDANKELVVETLRSIAELMIWGDQHDPRYFDYFAENNLIHHFAKFLEQKGNRRGDVAKQVLQTLSILIQNIRSTTAIFYLFSNNVVNEIVAMRFDFEDDEVLGYFINLLKTISLKVDLDSMHASTRLSTHNLGTDICGFKMQFNASTVQFFFQDDGEHSSFPLYTEAVKFINHRDGMVRAAVRTLTLNVYSIRDPAVQAFVISKPASSYFNELAIFVAEQSQALDRQLPKLEEGTSVSAFSMENVLAEVEDLLSYCNDILCTGETFLTQLLLQRLCEAFVKPILLQPLRPREEASDKSSEHSTTVSSRLSDRGKVGTLAALSIFERLLHVITHGRLVNLLASAVLLNTSDSSASARSTKSNCEEADDVQPSISQRSMSPKGHTVGIMPGSYKDHFMTGLKSRDVAVSAAAVRVLCGLLHHKSVDPEILDAAGLLPHRRRKNKELLEELTRDASMKRSPGQGPVPASEPEAGVLEDRQQSNSQAGPSSPGHNHTSPSKSMQKSAGSPDALPGSGNCSPRHSRQGGSDYVDALCALLLLQALPSSALWGIGWLLLQIFGLRKAGTHMSEMQQQVLHSAVARAQKEIQHEIQGTWCDALACLLVLEWPRARKHLLTPAPQSTSVVVQAWMQACHISKIAHRGWAMATLPDLMNGWQAGAPPSAMLAMRTHHAVQRFACLACLQQGLLQGKIAEKCPLGDFSEEAMKEREIREGLEVELGRRLPCSVSFTRGQERSVHFAIVGLPQVDFTGNPGELLQASPSIVLANNGPQTQTGKVLSVAPLMGATALIDAGHARWLHVKVRPPARGLLKAARNTSIGSMRNQMQKQLVDGHWILAFRDAVAAQQAARMVTDLSANLRQHLSDVLAPFIRCEEAAGREDVSQSPLSE